MTAAALSSRNGARTASRPALGPLGWAGLALVAAFALLPLVVTDKFVLSVATTLCITSIAAASLHLIIRTGHVSLGHAAFMGVGAYACVIAVMQFGLPFAVGVVAAFLAPAALALLIGPLVLRLTGKYFVLVTFLLGEIVRMVFVEWKTVTGGANGIFGVPPPAPMFVDPVAYYYLALGFTVVLIGFMARLLTSEFGRTIDAVRESEQLAECSGVPVLRLKVTRLRHCRHRRCAAGAFHPLYRSDLVLDHPVAQPGGDERHRRHADAGRATGRRIVPGRAAGVPAQLCRAAAHHLRHHPDHRDGLPARRHRRGRPTATRVGAPPARREAGMSALLEVSGLTKRFGGLVAVSDLDFEVAQGEILGIIGPNGAGKTTAVNLVSGVIRPSGGRVLFDGRDVTAAPSHRLAGHGLVRTFQSTTVYGECTVRENTLRGAYLSLYPGFFHTLAGTAHARRMRAETEQRVHELIDWLGLADVADARAGDLPYGYQKTLGMVITLAAEPRLVMLDEPVAGLSAEEADHVRDTVLRVRERGITVVVIDHNMRFIKGLCDRVLVMNQGKRLAAGTPLEVLANPLVIEAYLGRGHAAAHHQ
jgi:branched-chain amino acid transport system ATP-binding protein